ncbi:hypothetical protein JVY00_08580 [Tsukamurella tyrosinosolvens]|uniref:hypothetical protein n=1 Tax=Tsukamurella tyrosinosolvens TaxID=57704 RepID=UPI001AF6A063|nr:hypothetical protein [Tsukamurella tyrosinosolvens]QRY86091.1 hypothetical protein JVY00_08580 [Tsukamurella tyrosinosolvens]
MSRLLVTSRSSAMPAAADPAALLAAAPPDARPYLGWALEKHQPYIFLAHNGQGRTCMTWVLQSNGSIVGFAGPGPYTGGLLPAQTLTNTPQER